MENALPQFSRRVENYIKYRPGYPQAIIDLLGKECHLTTSALIADIGSGTGKLTPLFLNNGYRVVGIEPDPEMRAARNGSCRSIRASPASRQLLRPLRSLITALMW